VAGYEVTYRLCDALRGCARQRFYGSPIKNIFGATVTTGSMLGLDNEGMLNAMGIAGSMASGLREWTSDPKGTMIKRFNGGGWPSHNGVMAARLAQKGLTGPATILEGDRGICRAFGIEREPKIEKLTENLGEHYMIMMREIKPYGTCGGLQRGVEAANELKRLHDIKPDQIERVDIGCSFKVYDQHDSKKPQSIMAAQYSLPFVTALAFFADLSDPLSWNERVLNDPAVVELVQKVNMSIDEELDRISKKTNEYGGIKMKVKLKDGHERDVMVRYFKGQIQNPATPEDILKKFNAMAKHIFPQKRLDEIVRIVDRLEKEERADNLSKALMKL
jgi:2-methylcitrate dehydratase PrpD